MTKTPRTSRANAKANAAARTRISTRKVIADARQVAADAEQADATAKAPRKNRRDAAIHARVAAASPATVDPNPIPIDVFGEAAELRAGADQIEAEREAAGVATPDDAEFVETLDQAVTNEVEAANSTVGDTDAEPSEPEPLPAIEPEPAPPETITRASGDMALVVDVGPHECTTLAARIAAMLGRKVLIVDMISLRTLQTVEPPAPVATTAAGGGKARSVIVAACTRPEGATSKELFEATGWKYASWSHQLKIAATSGGFEADIRKVDGTTRYFLTKAAVATPEPPTEPDAHREAA